MVSPIHGFPTSDQIFKDIPTFDEAYLGGENEIRKDVLHSGSWELTLERAGGGL